MINFKKLDDSLVSLGIGQKALIIKWLDEMNVKIYTINNDYTIDVNCNVYLDSKGLGKFPDYIKFGRVGGSFFCSGNQLISLEGCPEKVASRFYCDCNQLMSLKGCPSLVYGNFYCKNNKKQFCEEEVREVCNVIGNIYV